MQAFENPFSMSEPTLALLALVAGVLLLVGVSVRLARTPCDTLGSWSRFFLVCLRLVIGWHFLVEGLDKLQSPTWTSEGYLREASGPLAPHFRELAGDRLRDALTVGEDKTFPAELDLQWQTYLDAFSNFYELNAEQRQRAKDVLDRKKQETLVWLTTTKHAVAKPAPYPPPLTVEMTMPERLEYYRLLQDEAARVEALLPQLGAEIHDKHKTAKANLNKVRGDLKRDLEAQTLAMKKALRDDVLFGILRDSVPADYQKKLKPLDLGEKKGKVAALEAKKEAGPAKGGPTRAEQTTDTAAKQEPVKKDTEKKDTEKKEPEKKPAAKKDDKKEEIDPVKAERDWINNIRTVYGQIRLAQTSDQNLTLPSQAETIFTHAYDKRLDDMAPDDPLPQSVSRPVGAWTLLDWSDAIVKYGLVAVGACLLVGFLTRTACLAGALFLLSFFLAMPPLPWLPESPRAEGHYLYINKNIIEMTALMALATMRTGRWAGLDGVLQFLCPSRWRAAPQSGTVK
jgi:uncharacterized membrane protein YphA (DoxX/SURF4 family)